MKPLEHLNSEFRAIPLVAGRGNCSHEKKWHHSQFSHFTLEIKDITQTIKPHIHVEEETFGIVSDGWQST